MVSLVNKFAAKVEEKKGALSEDEVSALLLNTLCEYTHMNAHYIFHRTHMYNVHMQVYIQMYEL